jgi:hypothetical protein
VRDALLLVDVIQDFQHEDGDAARLEYTEQIVGAVVERNRML